MPLIETPVTLVLRPAALRPWLAGAWLGLLAVTVVAHLNASGTPRPWLANWFDVNAERSLLQVYQGMLWLALLGILAVAARRDRTHAPAWRLLATLCAAVALEQILALHVPLERWLAPLLGGGARLALAAPVAVAGALLARRLLPGLPGPARAVVVRAGLTWAAGALALYALSALLRAAGVHPLAAAPLEIASHALQLAAASYLLVQALALAGQARAPLEFDLAGAPRAALRRLAAVAAALVAVSLLAFLGQVLRGWRPDSLLWRLSLNGESSLATAFSGATLLSAALLLAAIAALKRQSADYWWRQWVLLAVVFVYLAVDELASLHEHLTDFVQAAIPLTSRVHFAWVLPVAPVVLVFGLLYLRFLWHLPPRTRWGCALAGALYLSGALGFELIGGWVLERFDAASPAYFISVTLEESLEMAGAMVFVHALLGYLAAHWGRVRVVLPAAPSG